MGSNELLQSGNDPGDPRVAEQGFVSHEVDARPLNEVFGERIERMSPKDKRALVQRHLDLARAYDGPGGP